MERAGAAVAHEADAGVPTRPALRGRSAAADRTGETDGSRRGFCARRACEAVETDAVEGCDVVIDALFGTGFHGEPRPDAAQLIERINACGHPVVSVDLPSGVDASTGEVAGVAVRAALTVTFHGEQGRASRRARQVPRRARSWSPTSVSRPCRPRRVARRPPCFGACRSGPRATRSSRRASVLVVGGVARDDGSARPDGDGGASLRCRLRHARRSAGMPRGRRGARARAGEARLRLGRRRGVDPGRGRAGGRRRDRPGARTQRRGARARRPAPRGASSFPSSSMPTRSSGFDPRRGLIRPS